MADEFTARFGLICACRRGDLTADSLVAQGDYGVEAGCPAGGHEAGEHRNQNQQRDGDVPPEYRGDAFTAEHGSWNKSARTGYEVIRVPLEGGRATGEYEDFLTGFTTPDGDVWGRPVGVAVAAAGSLMVSDDGSNSVWRGELQGKGGSLNVPWGQGTASAGGSPLARPLPACRRSAVCGPAPQSLATWRSRSR